MDLDLQKFLFETKPSRRELLGYRPRREKTYRVQVFRNHSFELIEHTLGAYLDYAGLGIAFSYSGYDDSLSFLELDPASDLALIWVDLTRYQAGNPADFLRERIVQLRMQFSGPILAVPLGGELPVRLPGTEVFSLSGIAAELGDAFLDERAQAASGTRLSGKAMLAAARALGLQWLPAMLRPALKAVVVDLDNTLYQGVLGEDGIGGVVLTPGHRRLQETLKALSGGGFFLCAVSKNDAGDVDALFDARTDFPLRKEDFTQILASWEEKADSIERLAKLLNIHPDSMVFVDDNIGELTAVRLAFPSIRVLHAWEDGGLTGAALREFPGLRKLRRSDEDGKRKQDVQANARREELRRQLSPEEYIRSLSIRLKLSCDLLPQAARVAELARKTNQFIFAYRRYGEADIEFRMSSGDYAVVTVSLADRLSDSGLVGVCVGRAETDYAAIEECFISCRALGRGIDDVIVLGAMDAVMRRLKKDKVRVSFQQGERNLPAQRFVEQHLSAYLEQPREFRFVVPDYLELES